MVERRTFNLWVMLGPCESVPGEWYAHCLDMDLVTQGRSLQHAFEMAIEACGTVLAEETAAGLDPLRRRAPQESWDELFSLLGQGARMSLEQALAHGQVARLAAQLVFHSEHVHKAPDIRATWSTPEPVALQA